jgi:hypothetical protein
MYCHIAHRPHKLYSSKYLFRKIQDEEDEEEDEE